MNAAEFNRLLEALIDALSYVDGLTEGELLTRADADGRAAEIGIVFLGQPLVLAAAPAEEPCPWCGAVPFDGHVCEETPAPADNKETA